MYDPNDPYADPYADPNADQNQNVTAPPPQPQPPLSLGNATPPPTAQEKSRLAQMAAAMRAGQGGGSMGGAPALPTPSADQDPESQLMADEKKKFNAGAGDSSGMGGQVMEILKLLG